MLDELSCSEVEKQEMAEEMYDHLQSLKLQKMKEGASEEQASEAALEAFGNEKRIGRELQKSLFPYLNVIKWGGSFFFLLLSFLLIREGMSLWHISTTIEPQPGSGIGVYFLVFEVNDRVPDTEILSYARTFLFAGLLTALLPFLLFNKKVLRHISGI